jgi:hypothetical protein
VVVNQELRKPIQLSNFGDTFAKTGKDSCPRGFDRDSPDRAQLPATTFRHGRRGDSIELLIYLALATIRLPWKPVSPLPVALPVPLRT